MTPVALSRATALLDSWSANIWRASWQGGLLVLAIWAIHRLLPTMPARCQCWLWRLGTLKFVIVLLLPPLLDLPLLPAPAVGTHVGPRLDVAVAAPVRQADRVHLSAVKVTQWPHLATILCYAWLVGIGGSFLRLSFAWNSARHLKKVGRTITDGPIIAQLRTQTRLFDLRSEPRLIEVPGGGSPMLLGIFRPAIVMPAETCLRLNDKEQTMVLGHELAHIRRGDLFWGLVAALIRSVFLFHPLVWLCELQLKLAQEVAADELAISKQNHDPIRYGSLLVSVVEKFDAKMGSRPLVSTLSLETAGPVHSLTRRLVAMSRIGRTSRWVFAGSGVLFAMVVILGIVPWRLVAAETKPAEYVVHIVVTEVRENEAKKILIAPNCTCIAGSGVCMESVYETGVLRVDVSSSLDKRPIEHVIETKITRYPNGLPAFPGSYPNPEEGDRALKKLSAKEREDLIRRNKAIMEAAEKNAVVLRSPKLFVLDGRPGKVIMPGDDGSHLEIEVTVSPFEEPRQAAPKTKEGDPQTLPDVAKDKRTLADYEAVPSPKSVQLNRRPYRMDAKSYGIVVSNDAEGGTRIAGVDKRTGEWKWLELPTNNQISFEPIMGDDVTAFIQHGEPISQLVVYNGRLNKWSVFPLQGRVVDVVPCVGDRMICYQLPDCVVAYSAARDTWGMLSTEATPAVGDDAVCVETAKGQYEFPDENGAWAAIQPPAAGRQ